MTLRSLTAPLVLLALVAAGCTDSGADTGSGDDDAGAGSAADIEVGPRGYGARIVRGADGVPHVVAADLRGASFGQGWASAQDHPCDLVDQVIEVHSQRSAAFGPGEDDENLQSDFGWAALGLVDVAREDYVELEGESRELVEGFTAGWNASFEAQGPDGIQDWCTGADWLRTLEPVEVYTYARSVTLLASGARLVDFVASAQPPTVEGNDAGGAPGEQALGVPGPDPAELGSNAWAVGSQRSDGGGGMLLGNPHFPWQGELRFSEVGITTDDGIDVYGAMLLGLPGVGIGFTDGVAWSHTVSAGNRFTAYLMELDPQDPTRYIMDGESVPMESREVTVEVLGEDGSTSEETRTYWSTEFGPVLDFPGVGWTRESTISYRDANLHNDAMVDQYLAMDRARSLEDLQDAHREHQGIPLFNTVAVDADGTAWYADTSATPNISPEAQQAYTERLEAGGLTAIAEEAGAVLLEGNTSRDRWVDDPDAPWPGVLPYDELPQVERSDYLMNANDSYWLPNAQAPIDGEFSILQGEAATARSVRTRENLAVLSDTSPAGPAGEDGLFDLDELTAAALRDEGYTEKQWREAVVQRCLAADGEVAHPEIPGSPGADPIPAATVDLAGACEVLQAWDGRYDTDSRGAVLWREFTERVDYDEMWAEGFDPEEPATTPSGLAPAPGEGADPVLVGLAEALGVLAAAGVEPDAPLGEVQFDGRSLEGRLPVPGGLGSEGVTNVVSGSSNASTMEERPSWPDPVVDDSTLTTEGYPITFGTSFLMAVAYGPDGPRARTILTYGQVGDPDLAGFTSGVEAFAAKSWKEVETDPEVLAADPDSTVVEVSA